MRFLVLGLVSSSHAHLFSTSVRKHCAWLAEQSSRGSLKARCRWGGGLLEQPLPGLWNPSVTADCSFFLSPRSSLFLHRELDRNDISGTIEDTNGAFSGLDKLKKLWVLPLSSFALSSIPFHFSNILSLFWGSLCFPTKKGKKRAFTILCKSFHPSPCSFFTAS